MRNIKTLLSAVIILLLLSAAGCKSETPEQTNKADYLVLLYLSGDANNGDNFFPTLQQAEDALYEIRNDDGTPKNGYSSVIVAALWDGPNELNDYVHSDSSTRLLELGPGYHDFGDSTNSGTYEIGKKQDWSLSSNTKDLSSTVGWLTKNGRQEANMGSQTILTEFLNWAGYRYTADHVILLFGDHGSGPTLEEDDLQKALMFDDDSNGDADEAHLTTSKIRNAVAGSSLAGKIDLIIEDLCLQSSIDEAYGLQGSAKYLIASENVTYGNSLGSYNLIKDMRSKTPVLTIAKDQISYYRDKWKGYETNAVMTFALIDLTAEEQYKAIKENVSKLASSIQGLGETSCAGVVKDIRSTSPDYGFLFNASYTKVRDLGLMAEELGKKYPSLTSETNAITDDLKKIILKSYVSGYNEIQEGKFDCPLAENAEYGLTIVVEKRAYQDISYNKWTLFGKDSKWSDLIVDFKE